MRTLFVTWDGPQVSYLEGLFLPIFAALKPHGHEFAVLQFTWGNRGKSERAAQMCETAGIAYRRVDVWRAGAGGAFVSALLGGREVDRAARDWRIDALMPRSLLPALSVLRSRSGRNLPLIFDADGLAADERVEFAGMSPRGPVYRILRWIEATAVRRANAVLVRMEAAIPILAKRGRASPDKFHVVTNGRNPQPFLDAGPRQAESKRPRLCYLGSIGPQYLPEQMLQLATQIRSHFPDTTFNIFTRDQDMAAVALSAAGLKGQEWIGIESLEPGDVPQALADCDVGFALRQPSFSMQAVAPLKFGDYLLAGVPIIGSESVGPVAEAIRSGCMTSANRPVDEITQWVADVMSNRGAYRERCRALGLAEFSLARSVEQYRAALEVIQRATPSRSPA